jgi:hypothetical protein
MILFSCSDSQKTKQQFETFDGSLYYSLATTYYVDQLAPDLIGSEVAITRPPLTWIELLQFKVLDTKQQFKSFCLFYMIPMQMEKNIYRGILKLAEVAPDEDCRGKFVRPAVVQLEEIDELSLYLESNSRDLPKENYQILPYTLTMKIKQRGKTFWTEYPLLNLNQKNFLIGGNAKAIHNQIHQLNSSAISDSAIPGVQILPLNSHYYAPIKQIQAGEIAEAKICHQVSDSCLGSSNECDQCAWGFYEGVSRRCKSGGTKFCGPLKCGDHGQPACLRGYAYRPGISLDGCYSDSASGFCKPGLKLVCDDNKVLICL